MDGSDGIELIKEFAIQSGKEDKISFDEVVVRTVDEGTCRKTNGEIIVAEIFEKKTVRLQQHSKSADLDFNPGDDSIKAIQTVWDEEPTEMLDTLRSRGEIRYKYIAGFGSRECIFCDGSGLEGTRTCSECRGSGRRSKDEVGYLQYRHISFEDRIWSDLYYSDDTRNLLPDESDFESAEVVEYGPDWYDPPAEASNKLPGRSNRYFAGDSIPKSAHIRDRRLLFADVSQQTISHKRVNYTLRGQDETYEIHKVGDAIEGELPSDGRGVTGKLLGTIIIGVIILTILTLPFWFLVVFSELLSNIVGI